LLTWPWRVGVQQVGTGVAQQLRGTAHRPPRDHQFRLAVRCQPRGVGPRRAVSITVDTLDGKSSVSDLLPDVLEEVEPRSLRVIA
jgi:hypothetical protein